MDKDHRRGNIKRGLLSDHSDSESDSETYIIDCRARSTKADGTQDEWSVTGGGSSTSSRDVNRDDERPMVVVTGDCRCGECEMEWFEQGWVCPRASHGEPMWRSQ